MEAFFIRLVITIGIIWLTQFLTTLFAIREPYAKLILGIVTLVMIVYLVGGIFISGPAFTFGLHS